MKSYCLGKGLIFVDNRNIGEFCLNNSKLHLRKKDMQLLTQKILRSLKDYSWNTHTPGRWGVGGGVGGQFYQSLGDLKFSPALERA